MAARGDLGDNLGPFPESRGLAVEDSRGKEAESVKLEGL